MSKVEQKLDALINVANAAKLLGDHAMDIACDDVLAIISALKDAQGLRAENERTMRNRDMWKGQVERQSETISTLRAENEKLRRPDMYWNIDNPEQPYGSIEELVEGEMYEYSLGNKGVVDVQVAIRAGDEAHWFEIIRDEHGEDVKDISTKALSSDERSQLRACRQVARGISNIPTARKAIGEEDG